MILNNSSLSRGRDAGVRYCHFCRLSRMISPVIIAGTAFLSIICANRSLLTAAICAGSRDRSCSYIWLVTKLKSNPEAIGEVDKFCTDDTPQLRFYQEQGYFQQIPPVHADLGELVSGRKPGRESPEERTMTANLGMALDDMAVAPLIYRKALQKGTGIRLPL